MRRFVFLVQCSEWHEDGIEKALGPFFTKADAEKAGAEYRHPVIDNCRPDTYGYVVPLAGPPA